MKKYIGLFIQNALMVSLWMFGFVGCTSFTEGNQMATDNWDTIVCWADKLFSHFDQSLLNLCATVVNAIASVLPVVQLPSVNLNSDFLSTVAFFLPISEMSTLIVTLLTAFSTGYAFYVVLRWLKVIR